LPVKSIRNALTRWYERHRRDLPWRRTRDPYAIWLSEIMLQQTRVAAVIPYYETFLAAFPDAAALASADEEKVLTMWAGLGYYSRARNMHRSARQIAASMFPRDYDSIRALAGVGDYTAAAIASIAFDLPHAAVDGNVRRVIVRLLNNNDAAIQSEADGLLDRKNPGRWNQAMMELGATICTPRDPKCESCPLSRQCAAHRAGTEGSLPGKKRKPETIRIEKTLLIIRRGGKLLLVPSPRVNGFWDLPEPFEGARPGALLGEFSHSITYHRYRFEVREARATRLPKDHRWFKESELAKIPLSTAAKKALH
jgi:A/G-specific adenine glycosylase